MDRLEFIEQTLIDLVEWRESLEDNANLKGLITDAITRFNKIGKLLAAVEGVEWTDYDQGGV